MVVSSTSVQTFVYVSAIRSSLDSFNCSQSAESDWINAMQVSSSLQLAHIQAWELLWISGVEVSGDSVLATHINASLYAVFSSVRSDWPWPASPGGLSTNGYWGRAFWDTEVCTRSTVVQ